MTFGEKITKAREDMNLNQRQLAVLLDVTPTRLNYWEKDKREPDVEMIKKLSSVLQVSADYLIGNTEDEEVPEISENATGKGGHMEFYKILEEIMAERNMGVADIAKACGLSDSTVRSMVERQQKKIALNVAFKLSEGLGVSLERLNGMPEKPKKSPSTEGSVPGERSVSIKETNQLLVALGYIQEGEELSDEDLAFLVHVIGLLDAWFRKTQ